MKKRNIFLLMTCGLLAMSSCSLDSLAKITNAAGSNIWGAEGRVNNQAVSDVLVSLDLDNVSNEDSLVNDTKQLFTDLNEAVENGTSTVNFEEVLKGLGRDDIFDKISTLDDHSIDELGKQLDKQVVVQPSDITALINSINSEDGLSGILEVDEDATLDEKLIKGYFKDIVNILETKGVTQCDIVAISLIASVTAPLSNEEEFTSDSVAEILNALSVADKLNSSIVDCMIGFVMQNLDNWGLKN